MAKYRTVTIYPDLIEKLKIRYPDLTPHKAIQELWKERNKADELQAKLDAIQERMQKLEELNSKLLSATLESQ